MKKKNIIKNTLIVALGTKISRVLGLLRDVIIANFFGTGYEAGAFVVAFTIPNLLRDIVGEGAANSAFVPVLTEYKVKATKKEFWGVAANILKIFFIVLGLITLAGVLVAPVIVRIIAPGFIKEAGAIAVTTNLAQIMFPYILFMGLAAYCMGVLNTLHHFKTPAFSYGLLNIALISCAIFLCPYIGVYGLAVGVLLGGALYASVQAIVLIKKGFRLNKGINFQEPAVKKIGKLLIPRIAGTAVYQINVLVDRMLASLFWVVGDGGIPALYYSYRLIQYPIGIFSNSLATAALPVLSGHSAGKNAEKFRETVSFSLKSVFLVMIPASIGLATLGKPIIRILFERGMFSFYSTDITYRALLFYCIGLFAYGGIKILAMSFYAMNDTKTPVKVAAGSLLVNIILSVTLMFPLKIGGLALATAIAGIFNFTVLFAILKKRVGGMDEKGILISFIKVSICAVPMGIACLRLNDIMLYDITSFSLSERVLRLLFVVFSGFAVFIVMAFIVKLEEAGRLVKWLLKKK